MRKHCKMWVIDTLHPRRFRGFLLSCVSCSYYYIIYPLFTCHWRVFKIVSHIHIYIYIPAKVVIFFFNLNAFYVYIYILFYFLQSPVTVTECRKLRMTWRRKRPVFTRGLITVLLRSPISCDFLCSGRSIRECRSSPAVAV